MFIIDGIIVGLIAGAIMGAFSQVGYTLRLIKSHLVVIDGAFALRMLKREPGTAAVYFMGTMIHLITGIVFGIVYYIIVELAEFDPQLPVAVTVYVFVLWLSMLAVALPVAGQGFLGNKIRRDVWLEQLLLHVIFGFAFWWVTTWIS